MAGVIIDRRGKIYDEFCYACSIDEAFGYPEDQRWVQENIPLMEIDAMYENPLAVRRVFWEHWMWAKKEFPGITIMAECGWPVEATFLNACVADAPAARNWDGPYPLHEIASFMLAAGMDPMATYARLENELPKHHPLADAKQSARLLVEALDLLQL